MGIFSRMIKSLQGPQCPLCGGRSTYSVAGLIDYAQLKEELRSKKEWLEAHDLPTGIPQFDSKHAERIRMPGFTKTDQEEDSHQRCTTCHSLLPPEFLNAGSGGRGFAVTVAGFAGTGKTTWLLNMLNPAFDDSYEIVRRSRWLQTRSYEYAEPATLAVLRDGARERTIIPYFLFGTTIQYDTSLILVRTLDVMGEMFQDPHLSKTKTLITRHLSMGSNNSGALLILNKFTSRLSSPPPEETQPQELKNIAHVFEKISLAPSVWRGVVWTHLDKAQWNQAGGAWLEQNLPSHADALLKLATAEATSPDGLTPLLDRIDSDLVWSLAGAVMRFAQIGRQSYEYHAKKRKKGVFPPFSDTTGTPVTKDVQESLVFLLLRLQMAYSLKAAKHETGKYEYLNQGGSAIYSGILGLARALYVLWDSLSGDLHQLIKEDPRFAVLPCGLVNGCSIWSDLILIQALGGSGVV